MENIMTVTISLRCYKYCLVWQLISALRMISVAFLTMTSNHEKCDYPKVAMVENLIMSADDNNKNCDFWAPCFAQMIVMKVTDRGGNNCYQ